MKWILLIGFVSLAEIALAQSFSLKGFKEVGDNVYLQKVDKGNGPKTNRGDYLMLNTVFLTEYDSTVFSSSIFNEGPVEYRISKEEKSPLITGLLHMRAGDSAIIAFPARQLYEDIKPDFYRPNLWMKYQVRIFSVEDSVAYVARQRVEQQKRMTRQSDSIVSYLMDKGMNAPFKTPNGAYIAWHKRGGGISPEQGDFISLHYRGYLMDGTVFDNSYNRGEPLEYVIGKMKLIKGWKEVIPFLREGDSVTIVIPSPLAYGKQGAGLSIPPNSILLFDIELLEASNETYQYNKDTTAIARYLRQHGLQATKYPNGVAIHISDSGDGRQPEPGCMLKLQYTAKLMEGQIVEDHWEEPRKFRTNTGAIPKGFAFALKQLSYGAEAQILVPSKLAYGPKGTDKIPSDAVLIYRVQMPGE